MSGGERFIDDSRAFAAGMEEERQQILVVLRHRHNELLDVFNRFAEDRNFYELLELDNLINLLEERNRKGS